MEKEYYLVPLSTRVGLLLTEFEASEALGRFSREIMHKGTRYSKVLPPENGR